MFCNPEPLGSLPLSSKCENVRLYCFCTPAFYTIVYLFIDGGLHSVYDVTIAYPDEIPEKEKDLVEGKIPQQVHFHIKR